MIGVENRELVTVGDNLQLKSESFGPVVAPEIIVVAVQTVLVRLEGEPPRISPSDALERQGSSAEETGVHGRGFTYRWQRSNSVLKTWNYPLIYVYSNHRELVRQQRADGVTGREVPEIGSVQGEIVSNVGGFGGWFAHDGPVLD